MKLLKAIFIWAFLLLSFAVFGQKNFRYKASLGAVDSGSFYAIPLWPSLLSKCNFSLSDLRIKDNNAIEIPFIQKEYAASNDITFVEFPIVSKTILADKKMHVILKVADSVATHLGIEIQNAVASRTVNINGSNDGQQWFIIKENIAVSDAEKYSQNSYFVNIILPQTNYHYFDVVFNDKDLLPVNILKAGSVYLRSNLPTTLYDTVVTSSIKQKDSAKASYAEFSFAEPYPIDKILLKFSGAKYYRREAILNLDSYNETPFTINSEKENWVTANAKPATFYVKIFNEDNHPALKVISAQGLIKKIIVYAYLEKGKTYNLFFGDSLAQAPVYDLKYFEKLIQQKATTVTISNIEKNVTPTETPALKPSSNKKIIWLAMGAVLIALLFITIKLTKEIDKKSN